MKKKEAVRHLPSFRSAIEEVTQNTTIDFQARSGRAKGVAKAGSHSMNQFLRRSTLWMKGFLKALFKRRGLHRRSLTLLEMQQLGEKRFVAVIRVGRQKFLIGGAPSSVSLLAELESRHPSLKPKQRLSQETA